MSQRTLVVCPGRGSYGKADLGSLARRDHPAARELVAACDAYRTAHGRAPVSELDAAPAYRAGIHVAGEHASLLTFAASMADWLELDRDKHDVVGVVGNSMGWYTALAVAGALPVEHAIRLVDTMGSYQARNVIGGQVMVPISDEDWSASPTRRAAVEATLASAREAGHTAGWSIDLGGFAVLGADKPGVRFLLEHLPATERGGRSFPLQLPLHSAFHTPLMEDASTRAREELRDLPFQSPVLPLVDGRGVVFRPRWADPSALRSYTLGHQVVEPYDFTLSVRTALRHLAPDVVVCLGPGNPLGGAVARTLLWEGWNGLRDRSTFQAQQPPLVRSFGIPEHRSALT